MGRGRGLGLRVQGSGLGAGLELGLGLGLRLGLGDHGSSGAIGRPSRLATTLSNTCTGWQRGTSVLQPVPMPAAPFSRSTGSRGTYCTGSIGLPG